MDTSACLLDIVDEVFFRFLGRRTYDPPMRVRSAAFFCFDFHEAIRLNSTSFVGWLFWFHATNYLVEPFCHENQSGVANARDFNSTSLLSQVA
jgi:hypothetical protein